MYRKPDNQFTIYDFKSPFDGALNPDNRWVKMAAIIPWDEIEKDYADLFAENIGNVAKPARMTLGSLIIRERGGFSDEETVEQIKENPYLQYFIGLTEYQKEAPFDPSLMTHFRKRFSLEVLDAINEKICQVNQKDKGGGPPSAKAQNS